MKIKPSTVLFIVLILFFSNHLSAQTPTMQVACGLDGGELEYINLVDKFPTWFFTQDYGGYGGRLVNDYLLQTWDGNTVPFSPNKMPLASNGSFYPHHVPVMASNGFNTYYQLWLNLEFNGAYTLMIDGKGSVNFDNIESQHFASDSTSYTFNNGLKINFTVSGVTPPDNTGFPATTGSGPGGMGYTSLWLTIIKSDSLNPVRNIRVIPPDYTDSKGIVHNLVEESKTHKFHPKLIEDLQKYSLFRCMDLCQTNGSETRNWNQTRAPGELGSASTPYIDMITLANEANKDIWLNIPHKATNGFADTLAILIKNNLKNGLKAYIEYSNEVWNGMFAQATWAGQQGMILGWSDNSGAKFYVRRSSEIFNRFERVFGKERNRLIMVCAWQVGGGNLDLGNYYNDPLINQTGSKPDAFAVAPYFYRIYQQSDIGVVGDCRWQTCDSCVALNVPSVQDIFSAMTSCIRNEVSNGLKNAQLGPQKFHIPLINYEGGPHAVGIYGAENSCLLTDHLNKANRDPQIYKIYQEWMDTVRASGVQMLNQFVDRGGWSKWGCWGLEEYRGQDSLSPKYRALSDWIKSNPIVLDTQAPSVPGTPVKTNSTATSVSFSWSPSTDNGIIVGYDIFLNNNYYGSSNCKENNSSYTVSGLNAGSVYSFSVRARDFGGNISELSQPLSASTDQRDTIKPGTVIDLKLVQKTSGEIKIQWSPSYDNDKVDKYIIDWGTGETSTTDVNCHISNLLPAHTYKICVFAVDPSGNKSNASYLIITTDYSPQLKAHKTNKTITIDGNLSESDWKPDIPVSKLVSYSDVIDNDTILIGLLWDNQYLYIGAKTTDKLLKGYYFWLGDGFEFLIDGNNNRSTSYEPGHDLKYTLQWNNPALNNNGFDTTNVIWKTKTLPNGWSCEMAIPWSLIGITSPKADLQLGFDAMYDDADNSTWDRDRQYTIIGDESIYSSCAQFASLTLSADSVAPIKPINLLVSNITMGSATISWSPSQDQSGIFGYNLLLDGIKVNDDPIPSTIYNLSGLNANKTYSVTIEAIDNNSLKTLSAATSFTTAGGNQIISFNALDNSNEEYYTTRKAINTIGKSVIPFSVQPDSLLYGKITGYNNQYNIRGGFKYIFNIDTIKDNNYPSIRGTNSGYMPGCLGVFTGEYTSSNFTGIFLWGKDVFLNGFNTFSNVAFDSTSDSKLVLVTKADIFSTIRFVVRANNKFYVSESVFNTVEDNSQYNKFELSGFGKNSTIGKRWAPFNPSDINMPVGNTLEYNATDLSNIDQIGLIFSVGRENWAYAFSLVQLSAYGIKKVDDKVAPSVPANLSATGINTSSCTLQWDASSDNVGVTGYYIYNISETGDTVLIGYTQQNHYLIGNLDSTKHWYFAIRATDREGNLSPWSNTIEVLLLSPDGYKVILTDQLKIRPNPASEFFSVDMPQLPNHTPAILKLYDMDGKVYHYQIVDPNGHTCVVSAIGLNPKIYILTIEGQNYKMTGKVLIKK